MNLITVGTFIAALFFPNSTPLQAEEFLEPLVSVVYELPITKKNDPIFCSCILTARAEGLDLPRGNAVDLIPNSFPIVGGGIIFKYGLEIKDGHFATILEFRNDGYWVVEGNYLKCERTYRLIEYNDPFIRGFWNKGEVS